MAGRLLQGAATRFFRHPDFTWITPELAVGAQFSQSDIPALAQAGIGSVLDLREEAQPQALTLGEYGLRLLHVPVRDGHAPTEEQMWKVTA